MIVMNLLICHTREFVVYMNVINIIFVKVVTKEFTINLLKNGGSGMLICNIIILCIIFHLLYFFIFFVIEIMAVTIIKQINKLKRRIRKEHEDSDSRFMEP